MKRIHLLFWLMASLLPALGLAQSAACDTIIATDGRVIAADIIKNDASGVLYSKCGDKGDSQYFLPKRNVQEVKYKKQQLEASQSATSAPVPGERKEHFRADATHRRPKVMLWAGLPILATANEELYHSARARVQFGIEVGFRKFPSVRLEALVLPIKFRYSGNYLVSNEKDPKKEGASGELGLVIKKFSVARLSGFVSRAYWGADIRVGRAEYSFIDVYGNGNKPGYKKFFYQRYMFCLGTQFTSEVIVFGFSLPIGMEFSSPLRGNFDYEGARSLTFQPSVSIGLRF